MKKIMNLALLMMVVCTVSACTNFGSEPAHYTYSGGIAFEPQPFDGFSSF